MTAGTQRSRRRASCACAVTRFACAPGASPVRNSVTSNGATSAPIAARGMNPSGHGRCSAPASRATSARRPPHEIATSCAPRSTALDAIDTVSSVSPEYDTAIASVSGPTNAGVRICFSTVIGTGSSSLNAAATTSPEIPEPPMPSTTMLRIVSPLGNASACTAPATSCAWASCSGSPATASRKSSVSVVTARTWA